MDLSGQHPVWDSIQQGLRDTQPSQQQAAVASYRGEYAHDTGTVADLSEDSAARASRYSAGAATPTPQRRASSRGRGSRGRRHRKQAQQARGAKRKSHGKPKKRAARGRGPQLRKPSQGINALRAKANANIKAGTNAKAQAPGALPAGGQRLTAEQSAVANTVGPVVAYAMAIISASIGSIAGLPMQPVAAAFTAAVVAAASADHVATGPLVSRLVEARKRQQQHRDFTAAVAQVRVPERLTYTDKPVDGQLSDNDDGATHDATTDDDDGAASSAASSASLRALSPPGASTHAARQQHLPATQPVALQHSFAHLSPRHASPRGAGSDADSDGASQRPTLDAGSKDDPLSYDRANARDRRSAGQRVRAERSRGKPKVHITREPGHAAAEDAEVPRHGDRRHLSHATHRQRRRKRHPQGAGLASLQLASSTANRVHSKRRRRRLRIHGESMATPVTAAVAVAAAAAAAGREEEEEEEGGVRFTSDASRSPASTAGEEEEAHRRGRDRRRRRRRRRRGRRSRGRRWRSQAMSSAGQGGREWSTSPRPQEEERKLADRSSAISVTGHHAQAHVQTPNHRLPPRRHQPAHSADEASPSAAPAAQPRVVTRRESNYDVAADDEVMMVTAASPRSRIPSRQGGATSSGDSDSESASGTL